MSYIKSKIGSFDNVNHRPGGGQFKIKLYGLHWETAEAKVGSFENIKHTPGGGKTKLIWPRPAPLCGSVDNANPVPGAANTKNPTRDLQWINQSRLGSMDNVNHVPGGGNVKIVTHKLKWMNESKCGSFENIHHRPGGGNTKIKTHVLPWRCSSRMSDNSEQASQDRSDDNNAYRDSSLEYSQEETTETTYGNDNFQQANYRKDTSPQQSIYGGDSFEQNFWEALYNGTLNTDDFDEDFQKQEFSENWPNDKYYGTNQKQANIKTNTDKCICINEKDKDGSKYQSKSSNVGIPPARRYMDNYHKDPVTGIYTKYDYNGTYRKHGYSGNNRKCSCCHKDDNAVKSQQTYRPVGCKIQKQEENGDFQSKKYSSSNYQKSVGCKDTQTQQELSGHFQRGTYTDNYKTPVCCKDMQKQQDNSDNFQSETYNDNYKKLVGFKNTQKQQNYDEDYETNEFDGEYQNDDQCYGDVERSHSDDSLHEEILSFLLRPPHPTCSYGHTMHNHHQHHKHHHM